MNAIANAVVGALLLWSWQSLLIVGFVAFIARVRPPASARIRHALWLVALLEISILPVANRAIHALPTPTHALSPVISFAQLPVSLESNARVTEQRLNWGALVGPVILIGWAAGVLISAIQPCRNYWRLRRIVAAGRRQVRPGCPVPLVYSAECFVPAVVGMLHPVILLPAGIGGWTSEAELRSILLHEVAHVERRDHWENALRTILGLVFFFHPAVRFALRQLLLERELACDKKVLDAGIQPTLYAETILKVAERSINARRGDCPAFHSEKLLERRITMILEHRFSTAANWLPPAIVRFAIVAALAALVLPQRPIAAKPQSLPQVQVTAPEPEQQVQNASLVPVEVAREIVTKVQVTAPATQLVGERVSGTIYDQSGAVIPGVTIVLSNASSSLSAITNDSGLYVFGRVDPGQYQLQARLPGFQTIDQTVSVLQGKPATADLILPLGKISTVMQVSASKAQPTPRPSGPTRIGGDISAPTLLSALKPIYPEFARANGVQGVVTLQGVIGTDGSVLSLQLESSPSPGLAGAAMDAVRRWRYRPAMLNGAPVEFPTSITVNFTLED